MDKTNAYRGLDFNLRPRRFPPRLIAVGGAFLVFTGMWLVLPSAAFYWLFLPIILLAVWMASYGWRPAVADLVKFLQLIERL